jgi:hypothetical protein
MIDTTPHSDKIPTHVVRVVPALVVGVANARSTVRLLDTQAEIEGVRCAVVGYVPQAGDRVLVHQLPDGTSYLTGVLHTALGPRITTGSGASAALDGSGETLCIRDADGQLVCEYDAMKSKVTLHAHEDLSITASRIGFRADEIEFSAATLNGAFENACWRAGKWELFAGRLHERARDKMTDVENVIQSTASQVRAVVSKTWELVSHRTRMRSSDNTSIDGKRILLG